MWFYLENSPVYKVPAQAGRASDRCYFLRRKEYLPKINGRITYSLWSLSVKSYFLALLLQT